MKTDKEKKILLNQLSKIPIIQIACEKVGIGRASYYRWRNEDKNFAKQANKAILDGLLLINDLAESQLIGTIKDKKIQGIAFWLKHHHPAYTTKVEVLAHLKSSSDNELTSEQQALIEKALKLANLNNKSNKTNK